MVFIDYEWMISIFLIMMNIGTGFLVATSCNHGGIRIKNWIIYICIHKIICKLSNDFFEFIGCI